MTLVVALLVAAAVGCLPGSAARHRRGSPPKQVGTRPTRSDPASPTVAAQDGQASVLGIAVCAELLSLAMRSGMGVSEAVETVGRIVGGTLGGHLVSVSAAARWGIPGHQAWARLPPAWSPVARALQLSDRAGIAPADLLAAAAEDIRRDERHRLDMAAARLGVRVVLPLGLAFLPAFVLTTIVPVVVALTQDVLR